MTEEQVFNLLTSDFSDDFFNELVKGIALRYQDVNNSLRNQYSEKRIALGLFPYKRLADINDFILALGKKYDNMSAKLCPNKISSSDYVELRTDSIILTHSYLRNPDDIVRSAIFRNDLAVENSQLDLFSSNEEKPIEKMYAIITHGILDRYSEIPDFINIAVPDSKNKKWVINKNLLDYLKLKKEDLILTVEEETIPEVELIKPKEIKKV